MGSAKSKQGYRLNREDLEFLKASVPTVVELMNQNHTSQKKMFLKFIYSEKAANFFRNLHLTFDYSTYSPKLGEDFAKFCGLLRIYEL